MENLLPVTQCHLSHSMVESQGSAATGRRHFPAPLQLRVPTQLRDDRLQFCPLEEMVGTAPELTAGEKHALPQGAAALAAPGLRPWDASEREINICFI